MDGIESGRWGGAQRGLVFTEYSERGAHKY